MADNSSKRPLSPHIQIYRWEINMVMSILHRATGIALSVGTLLVVAWLVAAASGLEAFGLVQTVLQHPLGQLALLGWSFALYFHMFSGIRHLAYDAGFLFPLKSANSAGYAVIALATLATVLTWVCVPCHMS